jgi:hypothetical protein
MSQEGAKLPERRSYDLQRCSRDLKKWAYPGDPAVTTRSRCRFVRKGQHAQGLRGSQNSSNRFNASLRGSTNGGAKAPSGYRLLGRREPTGCKRLLPKLNSIAWQDSHGVEVWSRLSVHQHTIHSDDASRAYPKNS